MSTRIAESTIQESVYAHQRRNATLVQHITERGGDTQRDRSIDCFFHTRNEDAAIALSASLQSHGFRDISVTLSDDRGEHPWTVQAVLTCTVAAFTAPKRVEELIRIAAQHDAVFDGWGTSLDELPPTI